MPDLYQNASVFVYPSLYEGFGLPVLEAMAAGVPVVTSKGSAMAEIAGRRPVIPAEAGIQGLDPRVSPPAGGSPEDDNSIATLVDPHAPQGIADAITRIIRDNAYSSQKRAAGVLIAARYSWKRVATETVKVYKSI